MSEELRRIRGENALEPVDDASARAVLERLEIDSNDQGKPSGETSSRGRAHSIGRTSAGTI